MSKELSQPLAKQIITAVVEHLADWPLPSAEAFRNAALGDGFITVNPMLNFGWKHEADHLHNLIAGTIRDGRMIDFGFIANDIMKAESIRSRAMFEAGELPAPYDEWIAVASWEGGMCGYYFRQDPDIPNETACMELYGVRIPAGVLLNDNGQPNPPMDIILIYDIITVKVLEVGDTLITPARLIPQVEAVTSHKDRELRGANCLDPLVTMLRFLSDASIPVVDHPAPTKLNEQRVKQGKFPIPPHTKVATAGYISLFQQSGSTKGKGQGGHHATPVAHSRRGHLRHLASGKIVHVRSSKVNWRDADEVRRLFYRVPNVTKH